MRVISGSLLGWKQQAHPEQRIAAMPIPEIDKELDINTYEDLRVLGEIWQRKQINAVELRTSVSTIRRLVIHNDLARCASPRLHKITYDVPQNKAFIHACQNGVFLFWQSGGAAVFGTHMRCAALSNPKALPKAVRAHERKLQKLPPFSTVPMSRDGFLKQKVLFLQGVFMTRHQVLSFAANKAGDAHYDKNRKGIDETIDCRAPRRLDRARHDNRDGRARDSRAH